MSRHIVLESMPTAASGQLVTAVTAQPVNSSQHGVSAAGQLVIRFWAVTSWLCDELTGSRTHDLYCAVWTRANLPNRYSALCRRPVTHAQTWASYSALYRFGRLSWTIYRWTTEAIDLVVIFALLMYMGKENTLARGPGHCTHECYSMHSGCIHARHLHVSSVISGHDHTIFLSFIPWTTVTSYLG